MRLAAIQERQNEKKVKVPQPIETISSLLSFEKLKRFLDKTLIEKAKGTPYHLSWHAAHVRDGSAALAAFEFLFAAFAGRRFGLV